MANLDRRWGRTCLVLAFAQAFVGLLHCSSSSEEGDGGRTICFPSSTGEGCTDGGPQADASQESPNDDPCSGDIDFNCSETCDKPKVDCTSNHCGIEPFRGSGAFSISEPGELPIVIRTPRNPPRLAVCAEACRLSDGAAIQYGAKVTLRTRGFKVRIRTAWPWQIAKRGVLDACTFEGACVEGAFAEQYVIYPAFDTATEIPARTITIEEVPAGEAACP